MVQLRHLNNDVGELKNIPNLRSFAIEQEFKTIVHVMLSIILGYVDFNSFQINATVWCSLPFAYYIDRLVEKITRHRYLKTIICAQSQQTSGALHTPRIIS